MIRKASQAQMLKMSKINFNNPFIVIKMARQLLRKISQKVNKAKLIKSIKKT